MSSYVDIAEVLAESISFTREDFDGTDSEYFLLLAYGEYCEGYSCLIKGSMYANNQ